jgi:pyridoxamine 5'-phosphate oxidase
VVEASRDESLADLRARSTAAQDGVDADDWRLWRVVPERVEFWQGSQDRRHTRIVFIRQQDGWRTVV